MAKWREGGGRRRDNSINARHFVFINGPFRQPDWSLKARLIGAGVRGKVRAYKTKDNWQGEKTFITTDDREDQGGGDVRVGTRETVQEQHWHNIRAYWRYNDNVTCHGCQLSTMHNTLPLNVMSQLVPRKAELQNRTFNGSRSCFQKLLPRRNF